MGDYLEDVFKLLFGLGTWIQNTRSLQGVIIRLYVYESPQGDGHITGELEIGPNNR